MGDDEDFTCGPCVGAVEFVNANGGNMSGCLGDIKNFRKNGKLEHVVAICKSCTPNAKSLRLWKGYYCRSCLDTSTCLCVFF